VAGGSGTRHLESLILEDTTSGARRSVPADALFVLIGSQPRTEWLGESIARDQWGFILTGPDLLDDRETRWPLDRAPLSLETSLPGVFAVGDARRGSVKRVASAVGEGAVSIPLVHRWLDTTARAKGGPGAGTRPVRVNDLPRSVQATSWRALTFTTPLGKTNR
jgi:thioredoxin reductase (NADPH)